MNSLVTMFILHSQQYGILGGNVRPALFASQPKFVSDLSDFGVTEMDLDEL